MKIVQEQILFDCLAQFEAGVSVETLVAKHPHAAAEIERFLAVAAHLQQMRLQPSLAAKQKSQKRFLQEAAQLRASQQPTGFSWYSLRRTLLPVASLAMIALLFGITFLFASASALPGGVLYKTKQWVESYRLDQATDATAVFNLRAQMNQERVREVKAILRTQETADVFFEGLINTKQGSNWIIAGVSVRVNSQTQIEGQADVGATVAVNGRTQNGHLYASSIIVLQDVPATVTPTATIPVTPTATSTATPTNTVTNTPTATTIPAISATPLVTGTPTTMPTTPTAVPPTPTTGPTSVPTVVVNNDNENDNDGDDSDDSSNNNDSNDNSGGNSGSNDNQNNNSGDDNENTNSGNDNSGGNNNGSDHSGGSNDNDDNDNGNSGSGGSGGGGDNGNDNDDNGNENGRRDDD
jgi:uncharacterized membrane protein YgcG